MKYSTFTAGGRTLYGAATDAGMIALNDDFPHWPTLFDAVQAGGLEALGQADAYDHIAALTICNEGTIRDWVRHAKFNVTQGKNWDRSAAMGPWIVPFTDASQLDDARIVTRVNGEVRQDNTLSRMMFPVRREIEYISTFMILQPGDIIVTGTPTGAGARFDPPRYLAPGDVVEVEVNGIGTLRNGVEDEAA